MILRVGVTAHKLLERDHRVRLNEGELDAVYVAVGRHVPEVDPWDEVAPDRELNDRSQSTIEPTSRERGITHRITPHR